MTISRTRVVVLANLKGGSAKTTSTAYLAHALAHRGRSVIVVDADPQGSALRWQGEAEWAIPVIGMASVRLHRQLWGSVDTNRYDTILVDTPPLEEANGIVASALRVATDVIVPMAPTTMELDRLGPIWHAIEDASDIAETQPIVSVLLNRTVARASSTDVARHVLQGQGHRVLGPTIPRREYYGQAFGAPVDPDDDAYGAVAEQLLTDWAVMERVAV